MLEELEILGHDFFVCLLGTFGTRVHRAKKLAPLDTFLRDHEPNRVSEMNLNYLQNMPIYHLSRKYKLLIRSFLEYCYTVVFVHDISFPSKGRLLYETNVHKICPFLH